MSRGGVELVTALPSAELRAHVRAYTGYSEPCPVVNRELPSGEVVLVVGLASPLKILEPRSGSVVRRRAFVAGVHDGHVLTESSGPQLGIEIRLAPTGAYRLLGVPMHTLANRAVALDEVLGDAAEPLAERLYALDGWTARFALLDRELARLLHEGPSASPSVTWAWSRLVETSGRASIASLANELSCTRKHLAQRFREQIGVPPKTLARVLRFARAVRGLRHGNRSLADVALDCGYYDQAHFNRELRELAGVTPLELRAVTSVQDRDARAV